MSKLINSQKIKDNLVLTKHGITRLNERISKAYFSKLKNTSIKDKIKHLIDISISIYQNTDCTISIWVNEYIEMIFMENNNKYYLITIKEKSNSKKGDYIYKRLLSIKCTRQNKWYKTYKGKKIERSYIDNENIQKKSI